MGTRYYLMHKDTIVALLDMTETGQINRFKYNPNTTEWLPLQHKQDPQRHLMQWWADRAIPMNQDHIREFLQKRMMADTGEYLYKNLGLSLTDFYWIKPIDNPITWKQVNLFDNDFHDNVMLELDAETDRYSPNGSLQGTIEKTWTIINGTRMLVKGNHTPYLSSESLNEVFAEKIYRSQGYKNCAHYELTPIEGKAYAYGCRTPVFTSNKLESISAWSIVTSEPKPKAISLREHFCSICEKHGINRAELEYGLDLMILVDFLLSGYDRHLNNIAILRNEKGVFTQLAPIYDSGSCLFAQKEPPARVRDIGKMKNNSFVGTEQGLLKSVRDFTILNLDKVPTVKELRDLYELDKNQTATNINMICEWYERKVYLLHGLQTGEDLNRFGIYIERGVSRQAGNDAR